MITQEILEKLMFDAIKKASCYIPSDIENAFNEAIDKECSSTSKVALEETLKSIKKSKELSSLACPDTGWPLFFIEIGEKAKIENGFCAIETVAKAAVEKATHEGYLRATMKHPFTGHDPGNNIGNNIPGFTYKFVSGDTIKITFVPKGGGSECFGGTRYQVIAFADGMRAIKKFIIDAYAAASRAGAICPPAVLGVGIGGTSDISTKLAKEAATLRKVGSENPEPEIAQLEKDLYKGINQLGIGAMGSGGDVSVFSVNIEYAYTHLAGIAVSINANCFVTRRATLEVDSSGQIIEHESPNWFNGR